MEDFLIKALQLILSLSILVVLHELGHFIPAKLFKTKVEKFYLFFDPWFSLFKFKKGETEYGVGWLPLGGYVKIAGMIDESMDKEQMDKEPEPWEFRSKPAWQRLIIMVGGVTVNVLLAFLIYSLTLLYYGDTYLEIDQLKDGVAIINPAVEEIGFKTGDKIISVDGVKQNRFDRLPLEILVGKTVMVEREGKMTEIKIPENVISLVSAYRKVPFFTPRIPAIADSLIAGTPSELAGMQKGDKVIKIDEYDITYFDEMQQLVKSNSGETIQLSVERNGSILTLPVSVSDSGLIGMYPQFMSLKEMNDIGLYELTHDEFSILTCFPAGVSKGILSLRDYYVQFKMILKPSTGAYKQIGGFGAIGGMFPSVWDWQIFWQMTALLSVILAFMNILPIPALDGGHVMFLLYEIITRRKPNEKVMEYAQMAGMILLLTLLVYANGNDLLGLFK